MNNEQVRVLNEALIEVAGCFEAAQAEGLEEALMNATDDRLRDLVERRLMYAFRAAQPFTPRVFRDGDAICAVWPDFIDLQTSPAGFGDTKEDAIRNLIATSAAPERSGKLADELSPVQKQAIDGFDQVMQERDRYHEMADDLAAQIAAITSEDIGEHSSANDPWRNAMLAADEFIAVQLRGFLKKHSTPEADSSSAAPSERSINTIEFQRMVGDLMGCRWKVLPTNVEKLINYIDQHIARLAAPSPTRESLSAPKTWQQRIAEDSTFNGVMSKEHMFDYVVSEVIDWRRMTQVALATPRQTEDPAAEDERLSKRIGATKGALASALRRPCIVKLEPGSSPSPFDPVFTTGTLDAEIPPRQPEDGPSQRLEFVRIINAQTSLGEQRTYDLADALIKVIHQPEDGSGLSAASVHTILVKHLGWVGGPDWTDEAQAICTDLASTFAPKETAVQGGVPEAIRGALELAESALSGTWSYIKDSGSIADQVNNAGIAINDILHPAPTGASK